MPLGPFNNLYGMGASPVIVGDLVVLACDQSLGSFIIAVNKRTGRVQWKVDRPEAKSGHSTPIVWRGPGGSDQILVPGSFLLTAYDASDGPETVVGGRTVVRDEVDARHWRRHDLRERLRRTRERPRQEGHDPAGRRGVEDGRCRRQRAPLEGRVPEVHRRVLVRRRRSRPERRADSRRVGVLPCRARFRERHARHPPRRLRGHERHSRSAGSTSAACRNCPRRSSTAACCTW